MTVKFGSRYFSPVKVTAFALVSELLDLSRLQKMGVVDEGLLGWFIGEIGVDVADVGFATDRWHVFWSDLSGLKSIPIDGLEEGMVLDLLCVQAVGRVSLKQTSEQISCLWGEARQDLDILLRDLAQDLVAGLVALHGSLLEWIKTTDHLVCEHTKTPPIDSEAVTVSLDHFRGQVLGSSTESVGHAILRLFDLTQAKISHLDVTLRVEKYVFRLQISIDDTVLVEVLEGEDDLGGIEPSSVFTESNLVAQMEEEFSTIEEVCDEVEALSRLEGVMELDHERVIDLLHDIALDLCIVHLIRSNDKVFLERLNSVDLASVFLLSQVDFSEGAATNYFQQLEIVHTH